MAQPLQYGFQSNRSYGPYYRHSGKVTVVGGILAGAAGLAVGVAAAWIYAYVDTYLPIVQLNALACAGFGALVGAVPAMTMRWGKVRNIPVALAIVGVLCLAGYYLAWCAWIHVIFHRAQPETVITFDLLLKNPSLVWECVKAINAHGTWSMSSHGSSNSSNVTGVFLWVIWVAEAATMFGCALWMAKSILADRPFCEACDTWAAKPIQIATTGVGSGAGDVDSLRQRLERRDFTALQPLGPSQANDGKWLEYTLHQCGTCQKFATLTVTQVTVTKDKKGKATSAKKVLLEKLLVEPGDVEKLKANIAVAAPVPVVPLVTAAGDSAVTPQSPEGGV